MNLIKCNLVYASKITISVEIGDKIFFKTVESIKTIEHGECVAWFPHDVFKDNFEELLKDNLYFDADSNYLELYTPIGCLYDLNKIQALSETEDFQHERYSFFNYGYVNRLLNKRDPHQGVSGWF